MTKDGANMAVGTAALVTLASTSFMALSDGNMPSGRTVAGSFLAFAGLAGIAELAPEVGVGLSVAVAGTAFTLYGLPTLLKYFGAKGESDAILKLNPLYSGGAKPTNNKVAAALNRTTQHG
jgi:hypothetical protein